MRKVFDHLKNETDRSLPFLSIQNQCIFGKILSPMRSKCKSGKEAVKLPYIHTYIKDNPIDTHIHMNFTGTKKKHSELQLTLANAIPPIFSLIL